MKPLPRRTLLRGAGGVAIALPLLDAMLPRRARAQAAPPKRFVVYYKPGGAVLDTWRPTGTETAFTLGPVHKPLEPFKSRLIMLDGINLKITSIGVGHPHSKGMGGILTGRELPAGPYVTCGGNAGFPAGPSVDQVIASKIGTGTKFRSLEVAVNWPTDRRDGGKAAPTNCITYSGPAQPVPMATDPKAVWDRVFGDLGGDSQQLALARAKSRSILDAVIAEYQGVSARVGRDDRAKLDAHLAQIRDVELSLGAMASTANAACAKPAAPKPLGDPNAGLMGQPGSNTQKNPQLDARMPELGKAMMDLMVMAMTCDLTRVGTMQWVDSQAYNTFPFLGLNSGHHGYQHDLGFHPAELNAIDTWYMTQLAYFLQQLGSVNEAGKTLLDSTCVLFVTEIQKPDSHAQDNMPWMLAGGGWGLRTGRYVRYNGLPHNNLLTSLLNLYGMPDTKFGNPMFCTGPLTNLT